MKKIFLSILLILTTCFFLLSTPRVFAHNTNFSTSANVTYSVQSSGNTHVTFNMGLTNNTEKYYATQYKIHLGFQDIQNVTAYDNGGSIAPSLDKTADGEDLTIVFNKPAFGLNKTTPFTFSFDTREVASLNGSIWEVNIPGLSNASDFSTFTVQVVVPSYFGQPTYIKPATGNTSLTFSKDELGESGISLAFGDKQVYAFNLTYNLENNQLFPVHTEIALPPNTSYQHIEIDDISPRPSNVTLDSDGNWLAQYFLSPSQKIKIHTKGKAFVSLSPSKDTLSSSQYALYTKPEQYWQVNDSQIKTLASQLKTPEAIYQYVVKTLHYDFARISDTQNRLGAVGVLAHPDQAVCLEFTDLFITLARAAGIPARELDGYGYTQNTSQRPLSLQKEVLHAWPEYYDKASGSWIMVDPTWENTTGGVDYFHVFDFDHLTLVIKGSSSTYPVPAGGYKLSGQESEKDVDVAFAPQSIEPDPLANASLQSSSEFISGFPITSTLLIQNTGSILFPSQEVSAKIIHGISGDYLTQSIPPFGSFSLPIQFGRTSFLTNTNDMITIHFAGKTIAKSIRITAFSTPVLIGGGVILATILIIAISFITRRSRSVSVPR